MPTKSVPHWNVAWITGASSGIGRELAIRLAETGVKVAVSARSSDKLIALQDAHPGITAYPLDVVDEDATRQTVQQIRAELGPIDLAVLNAGYWQPIEVDALDLEAMRRSMDVNYFGIANAVTELIPDMISRQQGHLGLMASVAGYRGLPRSAAYGPSKAAAIHLAETLTADLARHNVHVSLINPGFVKTPMTETNDFPMPFIIEVDDAVDRIVRGLTRKKLEIAFPWKLAGLLKVFRVLPYRVYYALLSRFVVRR